MKSLLHCYLSHESDEQRYEQRTSYFSFVQLVQPWFYKKLGHQLMLWCPLYILWFTKWENTVHTLLHLSLSLSHTPVCAHAHTDSRTHKQILQHCLVSQIIWRPRSCIIGSLARLDWWNLAQSACGSSMCQWLITCILCFANKLNQLLIPLTCGAKGDTELTPSSATSSYQFSHVSLAVIVV